jgi:hypothetical protein
MTGILTRSHFYFTTEITHNSKSTPLITSHQIVQVNRLTVASSTKSLAVSLLFLEYL